MAQCIMQGLFQQSWGLVSNMEGNEGFDKRECEIGEVNEAVIWIRNEWVMVERKIGNEGFAREMEVLVCEFWNLNL